MPLTNNISNSSTFDIVGFLYRISLFFLLCVGAQAWFTWKFPATLVYSSISFIAWYYKTTNGIKFVWNRSLVIGILFGLFTYVYINWEWRFMAFITFIIQFYPLLVLRFDVNFSRTIDFILETLGAVLSVGLLLFFCFLIIGFPVATTISNESSFSYYFYNYVFLLKQVNLIGNINRFCGPFLEPGYLGTLCSYLLYLARYDFSKWTVKVLVVSLLASLSLAGIVVSVFGYLWINLQSRKTIKRLLYGLLTLIAIFFIAQNYNNGDNILNEKIFSRLEFDEEKGIKGNNRFSNMTDSYYEDLLLNDKVWTGLGSQTIQQINGGKTGNTDFNEQIRGAGYKIFILYNGILGVVGVFIFYLFIGPLSEKNKKYTLGFFLMIFITAIQATYPFSLSWLLPYVAATNRRNKKNEC